MSRSQLSKRIRMLYLGESDDHQKSQNKKLLVKFHKTKTCSWGFVLLQTMNFFLFSAIKTPGGHQLLLYSAFWFFLKADYETLHYFSYCPFLAIIKRRTPFFYFSKSRSWFMGDQQVFSSFIPPNKRVLFFNQNHTMLSTFHSKNMRFLKFWLKILRVSWCQGVDF